MNECSLPLFLFKAVYSLERVIKYQSLNDTESSAFVHKTIRSSIDFNLRSNLLDFLRT